MGSEEIVEDAFMDVFCDLVYGGGWMDIERGEETDRECNWALVNFLCDYLTSSLLLTLTQIEFKSLPLNKNSAPGGDPRTATTVFLFEEFVPLEYRQQLAKDSGGKRRLPFLFSPSSKSRPWKPAATLNGRPYVIGHVPKSPTFREVEFEGMLRSNGSKILSLSKPAPTITVSPMAQGDGDSRPGTAGSGRVSPARQLQRVPSDTPLTPASTKRRFRIPVPSPSVVRRSTLVPAEYSTVDFETRLASYSDDEFNESASAKALTPAEKRERRMSRDDAWVDILVAAHNRKMGSQEAERRPGVKGLKGGRSDPELASQEIALVLAGVRARSPLSDDDEIQVLPRQPATEPIPPSAVLQEEPKEQDVDIDSMMSYPKAKRVGYFDLHPERRPGGGKPLPVRPQVNANDSDGDDVPDHLVYGTPENSVFIPAPDPVRPSFETEGSDYGPSATSSPTREIDVPDFIDHERSREEKESSHSRAESMTLPQLTQTNNDIPKPTSQSKTASLIEMYRERERQSLTTTIPSKLPVWSASLPSKNAELPPTPPVRVPSPDYVTVSDPTGNGEAEPEPEADYLSLPDSDLLFSDSGRNSPGRYIHGAPLHNVLEEEEEEGE